MKVKKFEPENIVFFSILFDPDKNAIKNIMIANKCGYKSVVYINRVNSSFMYELNLLDVTILGRNENGGLGMAFSELEDYLKEHRIDYFLYFDQDTVVTDHAWKYIMHSFKSLFSSPEVGMLFYGSNKSNHSNVVVSSGCLFAMDTIKKIGNHNATFFVEGVDYEFCLRLRNFNYKIQNVYLYSIDHLTLQAGNTLKKFGLKFNIRIYGNKRLKDFNLSHIKLIKSSLISGQYKMVLFFIRSLVTFNFFEFYSRVLTRFF
jgi:rhamnosyltransferase